MMHRMLNVAGIASLLLCLSSIGLWIRSERHADVFRISRAATNFRVVYSADDAISVRRVWYVDPLGRLVVASPSPDLSIPYFIPVAITGTLSLALPLIPCLTRRRQVKAGVCVHCGYDLRASSNRCPKCGRPFANARNQPPPA